jgi:pimeloyl-ACP methyl ester carboxylesterase
VGAPAGGARAATRVIAYDVRGFGLSDAPREPGAYSQAQSVEDARALIEALDAAPAAVCGLSMGGNIALNLALTCPETVSALLLCDTGTGSEDPVAFAARCEEYAAAADRGIEAFFDAALGWAVFADYGSQGARTEGAGGARGEPAGGGGGPGTTARSASFLSGRISQPGW